MFNFYPYQENRMVFYEKLCHHFPFLQKEIIGKSLLNREIPAFTLGNSKSRVVLAGAFHGSEWLTINILLHFLWDLCRSLQYGCTVAGLKLKHPLNKRGISIIPCVNPDGVEINLKGFSAAKNYSSFVESITSSTCKWQANAAGVDLNHNFPAQWDKIHLEEEKLGITSPWYTRYGGKHPASEPETIAVMNYCLKNNFDLAYAFHSQGREIYWSFGNNTPKASLTLARLFSKTCGYKISTPPEIANGGGFKDWFIEKFQKPAFTFEIGKGENPLPLTDCNREYQILLKTLCLTTIV
jgi:g-D-glutamyl-meso-diaminopimelate peptidase